MHNLLKSFSTIKTEAYVFPDVSSFETPEDETEEENMDTAENAESHGVSETPDVSEESTEEPAEPTPLDYASIQAEAIVQDAHREAQTLLERAQAQARKEAERIYQEAKDAGRQEGYAEGVAQALELAKKDREAQAARMEEEVQRFLEQAGVAVDRQLDESMDDLRDLAIAIAEKVICISLKSSTEIIGRMVQMALDKRKHREWVHIYIAECDVKRMGQIPVSLVSAISALSDRVRIIPMADDESGTCVIEMPDEIIDASTSTQLGNIRNLLSSSRQSDGDMAVFSL